MFDFIRTCGSDYTDLVFCFLLFFFFFFYKYSAPADREIIFKARTGTILNQNTILKPNTIRRFLFKRLRSLPISCISQPTVSKIQEVLTLLGAAKSTGQSTGTLYHLHHFQCQSSSCLPIIFLLIYSYMDQFTRGAQCFCRSASGHASRCGLAFPGSIRILFYCPSKSPGSARNTSC